ncbi:hypothetical protein ADEAN_000289500 [Angomonas deanei]|uniref:Uncharacterized protein n=1 Tax=Angomonas deanei TaxID=59799 RepID=A0A7G2C6N0_9TRYP|nr:hypothetical protein ADEAN_000289500 [Angomonas deanei]
MQKALETMQGDVGEGAEVNSEMRRHRVTQWQDEAGSTENIDDDFPLHHFYGDGQRCQYTDVMDLLKSRPSHVLSDHSSDLAEEEERKEDNKRAEWMTGWRSINKNANGVPFRKQFKESEKRFKEQLEVHREITNAMNQIKSVERQTKVLKAERRTTALVTTILSRQNAALLRTFPADTPFWKQMEEEEERLSRIAFVTPPYYLERDHGPPAAAPPPAAVKKEEPKAAVPAKPDPMLEVLAQFSKPKISATASETSRAGKKGKSSKEPPPVPTKTLASIQVAKLEPEPVPYKRIRYVLRKEPSPPQVDKSSDTTKKTETDAIADEVSVAEEVEDSIEDDIEEDYSNDSFESSISDDVAMEVDSDDVSGASSGDSIDDMIESEDRSSRSPKVDSVELRDVLAQFYEACRTANKLSVLLTGKSKGAFEKERVTKDDQSDQSSEHSADGSELASAKEKDKAWQKTLQRDFADVKRLRLFNKHIQKNIKAIDLQRKIREDKRKLVEKAVKLSKAKRKQRNNAGYRIKDLIDDEIESVLGSVDSTLRKRKKKKRGSDDDDIEDEIISDYDMGSDNVNSDDSIIDDMVDSFNSSEMGSDGDDDGIADEIEDEWGSSGDGSKVGDSIDDIALDFSDDVDEAVDSDALLDEVEDDLVEVLASVSISEVGDMISEVDLDGLPDEASTASIVDDFPSSKDSSVPSVVEDELGEVEEEVPVQDTDRQRSSVYSSSLTSLVHSSDADQSSLYPNTETSSYMNSSDISREEAVEGEVALQQLEADMAATRHRRQKALQGVEGGGTETLSALYDPKVPPGEDDSSDDEETPEEESPVVTKKEEEVEVVAPPEEEALPQHLTATEEVLPKFYREEHVPPAVVAAAPPAPPVEEKKHRYMADDFVALNEWKERQKQLFRQILPSASEVHATSDSTEEVKSFAHHWGGIGVSPRDAIQQQAAPRLRGLELPPQ